eukprot:scaffold508842_cov19-Prasinocladus_malaysianus.AAC.1
MPGIPFAQDVALCERRFVLYSRYVPLSLAASDIMHDRYKAVHCMLSYDATSSQRRYNPIHTP